MRRPSTGTRTLGARRLSSGSSQRLADVGRQILVEWDEFVPARLGVAALTPGEIGGEILDVDLVPCSVEGDLVEGHALDLDGQESLVAVGGQRDLDDLVE